MLALTSVSGAKSRLRWLRFGDGSKRCITRQGGTGAAGARPCVMAKWRLSVPPGCRRARSVSEAMPSGRGQKVIPLPGQALSADRCPPARGGS